MLSIHYAFRQLSKRLGFTAAVLSCFALGIGANAAAFGVIDTLFFRAPALVVDPDRVVRVYIKALYHGQGEFITNRRTFSQYKAIRDGVAGFSRTAGYWAGLLPFGTGINAEKVSTVLATHTLFPLLGVSPANGRFFDNDDDRVGATPVAVLGHAFWARQFARDKSVLGHGIHIGNVTYTVIGIAPLGFTGADLNEVDVWLPFESAAPDILGKDALTSPFNAWVTVVGRLGTGISPGIVESQVATAYSASDSPMFQRPVIHASLGPIQSALGPHLTRDAQVVVWIGGMSFIVLVIACANVANLLFARGIQRRREIAIRLALGGGRIRIVADLLMENVLLALLGGAVALGLGSLVTRPLATLVLPEGLPVSSVLGFRTLLFVLALAAGAGLISGLAPAIEVVHADLVGGLSSSIRGSSSRLQGIRSGLLAVQVALSFTLLVAAGLFFRSMKNVSSLDLGFEPDALEIVTLDLRGSSFQGRSSIEDLYRRLLERIQSVPAVAQAAISFSSPFGQRWSASIHLPGTGDSPQLRDESFYYDAVTPGYFRTLGIALERGRPFSSADVHGTPKVAIVNRALAARLWPGADPLGKCFENGDDRSCTTVVGVSADVSEFGVTQPSPMEFYIPLSQDESNSPPDALVIRLKTDRYQIAGDLRKEILSVEPNLPYVEIVSGRTLVGPQARPWRMGQAMFGAYGALALLLTALGLYGMLFFTVAQQTKDIGIRMALGGGVRAIIESVVTKGLIPVGAGLALGVLVVLVGGRALEPLLFRTPARDPITIGTVIVTLLLVGFVASYQPARRATKVDPIVALRSE